MASHLAYSIPAKDRKKTLMRIPESHSLYVSPQSCARRQAIRAHKNGEADRSSFLQLTQADLVSGAYEGQVIGAVRELLRVLPQPPRVVQIFVNCVDDFLGTDSAALLDDLRASFPDVRFSLSHINPIAVDVEAEPMRKMQSGLYSLLEDPAVRDAGVTVLGGFVPLPADCELHRALAAVGAGPVRHVTACETFDEYLKLAQSSVVMSAGSMGDAMSEAFAARFGMRRVAWHPTYALDQVDARYEELSAALAAAGAGCEAAGAECGGAEGADRSGAGDAGCAGAGANREVAGAEASGSALREAMAAVTAPAREAARAAVRRALAAVGDAPVAVDSSATFAPYHLAHELRDYGFNVRACFAFHMKGGDADAAERLLCDYPQVRVVTESADEALREGAFAADGAAEVGGGDAAAEVGGEPGARGNRWLAIGSEAAFFTGAHRVVDSYHDEGYFGYQGIERLMNEMVDAVEGAAGASSAGGAGRACDAGAAGGSAGTVAASAAREGR